MMNDEDGVLRTGDYSLLRKHVASLEREDKLAPISTFDHFYIEWDSIPHLPIYVSMFESIIRRPAVSHLYDSQFSVYSAFQFLKRIFS